MHTVDKTALNLACVNRSTKLVLPTLCLPSKTILTSAPETTKKTVLKTFN